MRALIIALICLIPLASQSVTHEIDAQSCRPVVVSLDLHDLVAEPADFAAVQPSHSVLRISYETIASAFVPAATLRQMASRARAARQHQSPIYKLDVVFLI